MALASAKRIGELHSLSYCVSHSRNWSEVSFSFVPGFVAKTQDPSSLAPWFEGFLYWPYQTQEIIAVGDCYVLCGRSGVTLTALLHIVHVVSGCLSPQCVAKGDIEEHCLLLAPEDNITCLRALLYGTACSCPSISGDSWYCSVSSFQEELRCRPGVEGGYMAQAYHLYAPLLRDLAHRSLDTFHLGPVVAAQALV